MMRSVTMNAIDQAVLDVREGDIRAYRQIIALCEVKVRIVVSAILPDSQAVEDVAQEVFTQAFRKLDEYQEGTDFPAWIKEIARNLALNERRAWIRREAATLRYKARVEKAVERELADLMPDAEGDVIGDVRDCVNRLEGGLRGVVESYYWKGIPCPRIAQAQGHPADWAWTTLRRARTLIIRCLQKKGVLHGC